MTEPALSHEILRLIGAHWAGHRMLYTCTALYTSWRFDDHLITEREKILRLVNADALHDAHTSITIRRMPNGAYHGRCTATLVGLWSMTETLEYYRGDLISMAFHHSNHYSKSSIINGWWCSWETNSAVVTPDCADDVIGCLHVRSSMSSTDISRENVCHRDFAATARELIAQDSRAGTYQMIPLAMNWGRPLPGACY